MDPHQNARMCRLIGFILVTVTSLVFSWHGLCVCYYTRCQLFNVLLIAKVIMGHREFGNLTKVNRLVYFGLSPFEQRAFRSYLTKGLPNILRRISRQLFIIVPGITVAAYMIDWSKKGNFAFSKKNPEDFANDS